MSPDLIAFLKAWHDWANNGAPQWEPFDRTSGLCENSFEASGDLEIIRGIRGELQRMFDWKTHPFGQENYINRIYSATQHECPKRIAWVRERLIEAGELVA